MAAGAFLDIVVGTGASGPMTVVLPGGAPAVGDLIVSGQWIHGNNGPLMPTLAGFTLTPEGAQDAPPTGSGAGAMQLGYRIAQAGDTASYTWPTGLGTTSRLVIMRFAGPVGALIGHAGVYNPVFTGDPPWDHFCPCGSMALAGSALVVTAAAWATGGTTATVFSISRGTVRDSGLLTGAPRALIASELVAVPATVAPIANYNAGPDACNGTLGFTAAFAVGGGANAFPRSYW